jgi:hypothetical protein
MAAKDPGEYMKGVIERTKQYENPIDITEIWDLGPNFTDRYTVLTTSIDYETGKKRALIFDDRVDLYNPHNSRWISISPTQKLGKRIKFRDLPGNIQNYLGDYDIRTPENRKLREWAKQPKDKYIIEDVLRQLDGPENLEDFLEWIADRFVYVYGENPNVDFVVFLRKRAESARSIRSKLK